MANDHSIPFYGQLTFFPGILHQQYQVREVAVFPIKKYKNEYIIETETPTGEEWGVYSIDPVGDLSALAFCNSRDIAESFYLLLNRVCKIPVIEKAIQFHFDFNYKKYIDNITTPNRKQPFQSSITFYTYITESKEHFDNTEVDSLKLLISGEELTHSAIGLSNPIDMGYAQVCDPDEDPDYWSVFLHMASKYTTSGRILVADCDTQFTALTLQWILQAINRLIVR